MPSSAVPQWYFDAVIECAERNIGPLNSIIIKALYRYMLEGKDTDTAIDIVKKVESLL